MSQLQDAVTLAKDYKRTPLQTAAKRVYDALVTVQGLTALMRDRAVFEFESDRCDRFAREIERAFEPLALLMHEGDGE